MGNDLKDRLEKFGRNLPYPDDLIPEIRDRVSSKILLAIVLVSLGWLFFRDYTVIGGLIFLTGFVSWGTAELGIKFSGIELATLTTVLIGTAFGPWVGAASGFLVIILQLTAGQYVGPYIAWVIPGYAVAGALASILSGEIFMVGMTIILTLQAAFSLLTLIITPAGFPKYLPYAVGNVIFNFLAFKFLAPELVTLI